ncbi:Neurotransmitter-gated ion-channel ligand binding domain protein [Cooperia oncophora]
MAGCRLFSVYFCILISLTEGSKPTCDCDTVYRPPTGDTYKIDGHSKSIIEMIHGPEISGTSYDSADCLSDMRIVNYLLRPAAYNKHNLPYKRGVTVKVEFWIQEITAISEITNDFEMEMYINEMWTDPKLKFDHLNACKANISLDHATLIRVWTPNTCFVNSKTAEIHDSPFSNVFMTLFENGTVWVNYVGSTDKQFFKNSIL